MKPLKKCFLVPVSNEESGQATALFSALPPKILPSGPFEKILQNGKAYSYGVMPLTKKMLLVMIVVILLIAAARLTRRPSPPIAEKPRVELEEQELALLSQLVYAEAEGEPYEGQVAVAAVVLNRVDHPLFPDTIAGVIYEPHAFTVVANGRLYKQPDERARAAARAAVDGWDPSNGALYFYNPALARRSWLFSRTKIKTIGKHVFAK